jgi:hypothetical protein
MELAINVVGLKPTFGILGFARGTAEAVPFQISFSNRRRDQVRLYVKKSRGLKSAALMK